jgi:hypothetical protein
MRTWIPIVVLALVLAACEKREAPPQGAAAVDSSAADSSRSADSTRRADSAATAAEGKIIGRDSAFGPIGAIDDSTGKLIELPPRRP